MRHLLTVEKLTQALISHTEIANRYYGVFRRMPLHIQCMSGACLLHVAYSCCPLVGGLSWSHHHISHPPHTHIFAFDNTCINGYTWVNFPYFTFDTTSVFFTLDTTSYRPYSYINRSPNENCVINIYGIRGNTWVPKNPTQMSIETCYQGNNKSTAKTSH